MSTELTAEPRMSLFQIETELGELMAYREGEEFTEEERTTADGLIQEYVQRSIQKVDGILAYILHCTMLVDAAKDEAKRQTDRARAWQVRLDRLKNICQYVMEQIGKKRLDGRTGSLLVKGNGGRQPVILTDEDIVPDEYCEFSGRLCGLAYIQLMSVLIAVPLDTEALQIDLRTFQRTPRLSAIAEALAKPCDQCDGSGRTDNHVTGEVECSGCGGSGHQGVPGARLEPRGSHLEVK